MAFLANLLGYVLNYLYNWVQNYGWAIIIFSVLLKLILLPFTIKQQKNIKKSAKISEETSKLQVKYKNDPEKLNREIMDLYKREKASPFSGCLSSVLQLIIFISVFYLVSSPLTYMKKIDKTIIDNYKTELTESGQTSSYPEIKIIEPDGMWIKKEQLMELQEEFNKTAIEGSKRIYTILECEKLNKQAANSILKFLEEPNDDIIALLVIGS